MKKNKNEDKPLKYSGGDSHQRRKWKRKYILGKKKTEGENARGKI